MTNGYTRSPKLLKGAFVRISEEELGVASLMFDIVKKL